MESRLCSAVRFLNQARSLPNSDVAPICRQMTSTGIEILHAIALLKSLGLEKPYRSIDQE